MPDELPTPKGPNPSPHGGPGAARTGAAGNPWPFVIIVLVLCGVGWLVVSWMSDTTKIQDCVMSGRKNCAPLAPELGR